MNIKLTFIALILLGHLQLAFSAYQPVAETTIIRKLCNGLPNVYVPLAPDQSNKLQELIAKIKSAKLLSIPARLASKEAYLVLHEISPSVRPTEPMERDTRLIFAEGFVSINPNLENKTMQAYKDEVGLIPFVSGTYKELCPKFRTEYNCGCL